MFERCFRNGFLIPNTISAVAEHLSSGSLEELHFQLYSALMTPKYLLKIFIFHVKNIQKN